MPPLPARSKTDCAEEEMPCPHWSDRHIRSKPGTRYTALGTARPRNPLGFRSLKGKYPMPACGNQNGLENGCSSRNHAITGNGLVEQSCPQGTCSRRPSVWLTRPLNRVLVWILRVASSLERTAPWTYTSNSRTGEDGDVENDRPFHAEQNANRNRSNRPSTGHFPRSDHARIRTKPPAVGPARWTNTSQLTLANWSIGEFIALFQPGLPLVIHFAAFRPNQQDAMGFR